MKRLIATASVLALALSPAFAQDEPQPRKDTVRAFSLKVTGDGHVELTTKENGDEKTYKADSMEEFVKKYPDVAREHGVGKGGRHVWKFHEPAELAKQMEELRKQFGDFDFGPGFKRPVAPEKPAAPSGPRLGIRLAPLSDVLAEQLGIDAAKGALIVDVEAGSLAEKAGLKKNDVLMKIDGKDAAGVESVRATVQDALKKKDFDLEILRHGKKQTVKVQA